MKYILFVCVLSLVSCEQGRMRKVETRDSVMIESYMDSMAWGDTDNGV